MPITVYANPNQPKRLSGKGNITRTAIFLRKLNSFYGELFDDGLCFSDSEITVI